MATDFIRRLEAFAEARRAELREIEALIQRAESARARKAKKARGGSRA
jgi:hypothetical protein